MRKIFLMLILALLFTSCGGADDVAEFEADQQSSDAVAKDIANYLADFAEIKNCNVHIDGKTAVIGLDLEHKHSDAELIALKRRITAEIKSQNSTITRVAINTTPDMLENIQGEGDSVAPAEKSLEENNDKEIFVNIAPTV